MLNPDLSNVDVEEKYKTFAQQKRKDEYQTVPCPYGAAPTQPWPGFLLCNQVTLLQLKKIFGKGKSAKAFIESLISGVLAASTNKIKQNNMLPSPVSMRP